MKLIASSILLLGVILSLVNPLIGSAGISLILGPRAKHIQLLIILITFLYAQPVTALLYAGIIIVINEIGRWVYVNYFFAKRSFMIDL